MRYKAATLHGVVDLVSAGLGVAIVPASMATVAPEGVTFRMLRNPTRVGAIAFAQMRGDPNVLVAVLSKLAVDVFAEFGEEINQAIVLFC